MFDLDRFKTAQERTADGFSAALAELQAGRKRGHWIWYIFPQLAGLGESAMSLSYGLQGAAEAADYLRDPVLRQRLLAVTETVAARLRGRPAPMLVDLMGSPIDVLKLVSCMTLFRAVARQLSASEPLADYIALAGRADDILDVAREQDVPECRSTLRQLARLPTTRS